MTIIFRKLLLLLWKNLVMDWHQIWQVIVQTTPFYVLMLLFLRNFIKPKPVDNFIYGPADALPINNLDLYREQEVETRPKEILVYSPNTSDVFGNIAREAAKSLGLASLGCANADALEDLMTDDDYFVGVEFSDSLANIKQYPDKLSFNIRFPSELRTSAKSLKITWSTNTLFELFQEPGPRNKKDKDGGIPVGYLREGFLPVQNAISMAFIKQSAGGSRALPEISLQRYPYAAYTKDVLLIILPHILPITILISYSPSFSTGTCYIVKEKENQLKEVMKILGLPNWMHWTAWFVKTFVIMGIVSLWITLALTITWGKKASVLPHSSDTAILLFFLVYTISTITFCFMLSTFFSKTLIAVVVVDLIFLATIVVYLIVEYNTLTLAAKLGWSLVPNVAMTFGVRIIISRELTGVGLQWNNMFDQVSVDDPLSMAHIFGAMCITSVIEMLICLYMEQVLPGEFGIPKRWNFPFTRSFWCGERREFAAIEDPVDLVPRGNDDSFEAEPSGKRAGVQVKNLSKRFDQVEVVKSLSMNMYEGEITVLLGHNGAGKTTTISMLTGMFPPTSGTATIAGCDIRTNMDGARKSMGICPQHNILFDLLTVQDHLFFYSSLKGLKFTDVKAEVKKYLERFNLEEKANVTVDKLSGGMKRKVSVCVAFCGGSKVVFCDEPSAGMDPAARRQLWNLLQSEKTGRTILLTTHLMDEADVLSDRIAIMSSGQLKCMGTSFFLKKKFGNGYRLICVKKEKCDSSKVTQLVGKYIPNIQPETEIGSELSYQLPDRYSPQFEKIFQDLETSSDSLGISGFGISISPLEAVFMNVGTENAPFMRPSPNANNLGPVDVESRIYNQRLVKGVTLLLNQWRAMILKKYLYTVRHKWLFALVNIIAALYFVQSIHSSGEFTFTALKPITLSLTQYPSTVTVLDDSSVADGSLEAEICRNYERVVTSYSANHQFAVTGEQNFIDYILELGKSMQARINERYIAAATVSAGKITAWLNNQPLHSAPLTVNLIHNALAKTFIHENVNIEVTNAPLPFSKESRLDQLNTMQSMGASIAMNTSMFVSITCAIYVILPIRESTSRAKFLQFVSGVRVLTFWLSHFAWDMFMFTLTSLVLILILACFQEEGYSTFDELGRTLLILQLFGCSALPLTYLLARLFSEPFTGYIYVLIIHIFPGFYLFTIWISLEKETQDEIAEYCLVFPQFAMVHSLHKLYTNTHLRKMCDLLKEETGSMCGPDHPECCNLQPFFGWEPPGVRRGVEYLLYSSVAFSFLVILLDFRIFGNIWSLIRKITRKQPSGTLDGIVDDDVEDEKKRIQDMSRAEIKAQNLTVNRMTKFYGKFLAVNQISVGVRHSECFGLLGVNGAGKTTTFKMLTGEERISLGEAYVKGIRLRTRMNRARREIGYCPQYDALFNEFTGRETLRIYALLRGIPSSMIPRMCSDLARSFDFLKHYDKKVGSCSGGTKRKVSTAIAIIGSPSVIYLDEPTAGMDPAACRQVWNMVCRVRDEGKAIVLTTHSMEECEALSTRLAIMVNGEFKCIGSTQHLKNKFSKGLILKIKVKKDKLTSNVDLVRSRVDDEETLPPELLKIFSFIKQKFPDATLQEHYHGLLTFYIPLSTIQWSKMFGLMEANKAAFNIEDYSICQTTLEEIFLQFATHQREDPNAVQ